MPQGRITTAELAQGQVAIAQTLDALNSRIDALSGQPEATPKESKGSKSQTKAAKRPEYRIEQVWSERTTAGNVFVCYTEHRGGKKPVTRRVSKVAMQALIDHVDEMGGVSEAFAPKNANAS